MAKTIVLVTGGFDPLHSGHIEYFNAAKRLGDILVVGLNSDEWLTRKKGKPFLSFFERNEIVSNLRMVDLTLGFDDIDGSAIGAIESTRNIFRHDKIIFANGGDRTQENIPEMSYEDLRVVFEFGIGGENKKNSSSWILKEWSKWTR